MFLPKGRYSVPHNFDSESSGVVNLLPVRRALEMRSSQEVRGTSTRNKLQYWEKYAGDYTPRDGSVEFYTRVGALLRSTDTIVDLGAGRGRSEEDRVPARASLQNFRGRARKIIGLDVDGAVLQNPKVDAGLVFDPKDALPLEDGTADLIVSDFTFEHIEFPEHTTSEIDRVLKPGGWLCARTPNRWGMVGVATRAVPNDWHIRFLKTVQPAKLEIDTFPTFYRLNSLRQIRKHFPQGAYENFTYTYGSDPAYGAGSYAFTRIQSSLEKLAPAYCKSTLMIFVRKRTY
ncbi:class I SAM-dependent methyltransferase [Actinomycetospora endophytica]|uniref:class I SAM-dependent methyltransferase n=1 Tax=Actinomycetospora endophytica TaxID=2291215 RepID=UPI0035587306